MRCCAPACNLPLLLISLRSRRCGEASAARKVGRVLLVLYLVERDENDLLAPLGSRPCAGALTRTSETLLYGKRSLLDPVRRVDGDEHQRAAHNGDDIRM